MCPQNGDFEVNVEKFDAKTVERDKSEVTVGTKNSKKKTSNEVTKLSRS